MNNQKELINFDNLINITEKDIHIKNHINSINISIVSYVNDYTSINEKTIYSVLSQTYENFEWILYVNSSLNEAKLFNSLSFIKKDCRIKIIFMDDNFFSKKRVNWTDIHTKLVYFLNWNCILNNTLLETMYYTHLIHSNALLVFSDSISLDRKILNNKDVKSSIKKQIYFPNDSFLINIDFIDLPKEFDLNIILNNVSKKHLDIIRLNYYGVIYFNDNTLSKKHLAIKGYNFINYPLNEIFNYDTEPFLINENIQENNDAYILCFMPWSKIGGADIFNYNLLRYLKKFGIKICVITTEPCAYEARQSLESVVDEYFDLTTFIPRKYWPTFINHIIRSRNIKLIFQLSSLYGYYIIPFIKSLYPNIPILDYLHAEDFSWRNGGFPKDSTAVQSFIDKTYTCNAHLKSLMEEKMGHTTQNIDVSYIGVDSEKFDRNIVEITNKEIEAKCKNKHVILFPSRFSPEKRPIFLLHTIKALSQVRKDFICLMVGGGPLFHTIKSYIKDLNIKEFVEIIDLSSDIRQYYKLADVTVICSLSEGITLTTYESLSMGVPVISADIGGQNELIDTNCGSLIRPYQTIEKDLLNYNYSDEEVKSYCDEIIKIFDQFTTNSTSQYCREKILTNFSQDHCFNKLYQDICHYIKIGSQISNTPDIQFAIQYLVLFNETNQVYIEKENLMHSFSLLKLSLKTKLKSLWRFRIWRIFIKTIKKKF